MKQGWWKWLFSWEGRIGRLPYLAAGLTLAVAKYLIDRSVAAAFGSVWAIWNYIVTLPALTLLGQSRGNPRLYLVLWTIAIPFFWVGIALTLRRLRDAGKRGEWIFLLFLPFLNFALFLWLALAPSKAEENTNAQPQTSEHRAIVTAVLLTGALGLALTLLSTQYFQSYGFGLFLGVPFVAGFVASWLLNLNDSHSGAQTIGVSVAPIVTIGLGLIAFKFEGLVCLAMALPLAVPIAIAGGLAARDILRGRCETQRRPAVLGVAILPLMMSVEYAAKLEPPVIPVTTSITINAPASVVWENVISFPPLKPLSPASPSDWVFLTGIAYPTSGRIVGSGVGAVRYCHFSTGDFVEPITVWDKNRLLAFNVVAEPPALTELSPWKITPPHLERNYMRSLHGQFRLVALDDHHTLLEGTTWYQDYFWPQAYWQGWSDMIVHRIHLRVLSHVKERAEMEDIEMGAGALPRSSQSQPGGNTAFQNLKR